MFKVKYILEQWTFAVYNFTAAVTFATYENFLLLDKDMAASTAES